MRRFAFIAAVVLAALVSWVAFSSQSITLRYRLTLVVDDGGHEVTGSSVFETVWGGVAEYFPQLGPLYGGKRWSPIVKGEAVAVDLGARGVLFMLLSQDDTRAANARRSIGSALSPAGLLAAAFDCPSIGGVTWKLLHRIRGTRKPVNVPLQLLPMLVRFRDIKDPKSVELVDPYHLDNSFGFGVKLMRATIEMTDDKITTGIERWLPWLPSLKGGYLSGGQISTPGLSGNITVADFKAG